MALTTTPIVEGTIPYADFANNDIMYDYLFDDNNDALLDKINELVTRFNNMLLSVAALEANQSTVIVSATAPTNLNALWVDTVSGDILKYYDTVGAIWVTVKYSYE